MRPLIRFSLILAMGFLSLGTVVKKKDAIERTQTDPVTYQEKAKEEREGKKGPPVPTLELFPKERFLVEGPVNKMKGETPKKGEAVEESEEWGEEEFKLEEETDDTWEDSWEFEVHEETKEEVPRKSRSYEKGPSLDTGVDESYSLLKGK